MKGARRARLARVAVTGLILAGWLGVAILIPVHIVIHRHRGDRE